jgi:hypothetical protein
MFLLPASITPVCKFVYMPTDLGSQIPDPKTATKERGEKKCVVISFYVTTNFT